MSLDSLDDVYIDDSNLRGFIVKIALKFRPQWSEQRDQIEIRDLNGGITNRLLASYLKQNGMDTPETLLFRIYGKDTELFISRSDEITTMKLMKQISLGPEFYCQFKNGICYEYLPGRICDQKMILDENIYSRIAQGVATLHLVNFSGLLTEKDLRESGVNQAPFIFSKIRELIKLVKKDYKANMPHMTDGYFETVPSLEKINQEFEFLENYLRSYAQEHNSLIVFSHNDLLLGNIIYNDEAASIKFIDYEYGQINYQAYDIANHFNEFAGVEEPDYSLFPTHEYQLKWLRVYLESFYSKINRFFLKNEQEALSVTEDKLHQFNCEVNKFTLASHFMWAVWSLIQAQSSQLEFDFVRYAHIRFSEYFKRKDEVINLN